MDRLICGDVGYGKTEVAMRAAHQGGRRGQAGDDAGADDDPGPATPRHLPRAARRAAVRGRDGLAAPQAGRGPRRARPVCRRQNRHPHRHPPPAVARRARQGPRPRDRRRGAALRGQAEGAPAPAETQGRRPVAVGDADPADAADVPRRAPRHLGDRDAAGGPTAGAHLRRAFRRGARQAGDRARDGTRAGRPSSSTTESRPCPRSPSACARSRPGSGWPRRTGKWTRASSSRRC